MQQHTSLIPLEALSRTRSAADEKTARLEDIKQLAADKAFAKDVEKENKRFAAEALTKDESSFMY